MDSQGEDDSELLEPPPDATPFRHPYVPAPLDLSYRIVIRTVLWLIAGAVFLGFAIWWMLT